jgi:hypothetical protein
MYVQGRPHYLAPCHSLVGACVTAGPGIATIEGGLQLLPLAPLHAYSIRDNGMHAHACRSQVYAHRSTLHVTLYTQYNKWTSAARALSTDLLQAGPSSKRQDFSQQTTVNMLRTLKSHIAREVVVTRL